MPIVSIEEAIQTLRQGRMIILVDDEDRENEGDLCMLAEHVTPEAINFMAKYGRGLICLAMTPKHLEKLKIPMMVQDNQSRWGTAFTVSIEARYGVTTGISAADRATTILTAVAPDAKPHDLVSPGHVFPLAARPGGVLARTGQTEGSVDLARLSGSRSNAAVICEIMNDDGSMARMPDLLVFSEKHEIPIVTIADLITYRLEQESMVEEIYTSPLPLPQHPDFVAHVFKNRLDHTQHLALTLGDLQSDPPPLVRVQSSFLISDIFGALDRDDGPQLRHSLERIAREGKGAILYIYRPDRSFEWQLKHLKLSQLPEPDLGDEQVNMPPPALRNFGIGAQCLRSLGLKRIRLLTNNPQKIVGLKAFGLEIVQRIPLTLD